MRLLSLFLLGLAALAQDRLDPRVAIADITGTQRHPFAPQAAKLSALFFVTTDCPVSNSYAQEIRRICTTNAGRAMCYLIYVDPTVGGTATAKHKTDYGHGDYAAIIDSDHVLVKAVGATVTPEVALVDSAGSLIYRGRIDNSYVIAGRRRAVVTEHNLTDAIDATLAGKTIAEPRTKASGCFITPIEILKSLLTKPGPQ